MRPAAGNRLTESSVPSDNIDPRTLRERQVETIVDSVIELEGEAHRLRDVVLQQHDHNRCFGEPG